MSTYIDSDYVDNAIGGEDERRGLTDVTSGTDSVLTQFIEDASALVDAALFQAGYDAPLGSGTPPDIVKRATLSVLIPSLYARKGLSPPESFANAGFDPGIVNRIASGNFPIPTLDASKKHAIGGVKFTKSGDSDDNPPVMNNLRKVF